MTALLTGLALGRPELSALAVPFLLALVGGHVTTGDLDLNVALAAERERALEGEFFDVVMTISSNRSVARLNVEPSVPMGLRMSRAEAMDDGPPPHLEGDRLILGLTPDQPRRIRFVLECRQWGGYPVIDFLFSTSDLFGLFAYTSQVASRISLKVFPRAEELQRLLAPVDTQLSVGDLPSHRRGAGSEFSELRAYLPGDDPRRINWRASARREDLWVNEHHPDNNSDVVLLVDAPNGSRHPEVLALDATVRAVAALARAHLGRRDRVGLIVFGGVLRWLRPTVLADQRYQILDALADSRLRGGDLTVTALPRRAIPPKALVIGLSPLLDPGSITAFHELRGRGTDLVLVEIATSAFLPQPITEERQLARRLWELQRDQMRRQFRQHGVALAEWDPKDPLINALEEVSAFRSAMARR